jgi:hypothetical protein
MELWARWAVPKASSRETYVSTNPLIKDKGEKENLTDINISQSRQALPELIHLGLIRLDLLAILILIAALLFSMEPQVLQQDDLSITRLVNRILDVFSHAVVRKDDLLAAE